MLNWQAMPDWRSIDTVLLDMDGTLLDLEFDTVFWNELLPTRYAAAQGITRAQADAAFTAYIAEVQGTLEYYCVDAWARFTHLPVHRLKDELLHLIRFRPHAEALLQRLQAAGKDVRIVTNAHYASIDIKQHALGIRDTVPHFHTAHDLGHAKESAAFWQALTTCHPFDPARTLLIDDTEVVLDAGRAHGIACTLAVTTPDSGGPVRVPRRHPGIDSFATLIDGLPPADMSAGRAPR
jgi:HAD superfamily hydrolase (TIGR01509 family)